MKMTPQLANVAKRWQARYHNRKPQHSPSEISAITISWLPVTKNAHAAKESADVLAIEALMVLGMHLLEWQTT